MHNSCTFFLRLENFNIYYYNYAPEYLKYPADNSHLIIILFKVWINYGHFQNVIFYQN